MIAGMAKNRLNLATGVFFLMLLLVGPSLAGNNSGAAFSTWPDTGQTKCYDNSAEIPCSAAGQSFDGQDAQYNGPARSYTLIGGGSMVQDNVTGLIWEMKDNLDGTPDYSNPHNADNTYTWCDPDAATNGGNAGTCGDHDTKAFIDQLNSGSGFGGYTNWRMPTLKELGTLVDLGRINPAIDPIFASTTQSSYWSSTSGPPSLQAFALRFHFGSGDHDGDVKSMASYVRAVYSGQ